jgi:2-polyprenyl-3-methyl-5-hydroxy-6-metoxy-1,4-benzoquinol methylase
MSARAAKLFARVQDADFYREMHTTAVAALPSGEGRTWLDVGCGPGLLARTAADRGYTARGIDRDPDMIAAAVRLAAERKSPATFAAIDVEAEAASGRRYDVVSASSLLVVVPDARATLRCLEELVKPRGTVLILEATSAMTRGRALALALGGRLGRGAHMLVVWANARAGRALDEAVFQDSGLRGARTSLLGGMACSWSFERR